MHTTNNTKVQSVLKPFTKKIVQLLPQLFTFRLFTSPLAFPFKKQQLSCTVSNKNLLPLMALRR